MKKIFLLVFLTFFLVSCSNNSEIPNTETPKTTQTIEEKNENIFTLDGKNYTITPKNTEIKLSTRNIEIKNISFQDEVTDVAGETLKQDGIRWVIVDFIVINTTNKSEYESLMDLSLVNIENNNIFSAEKNFFLEGVLSKEINPNIPESGKLYYKVPSNTENIGIIFSSLSGENFIVTNK